jgi:hypothetical protein
VTGSSLSSPNRAHISSLCAPFLHFRIKPGTFVFFMCPVSTFHHQTGHISLLYVPHFYISSPNRAHIFSLCAPFLHFITKPGTYLFFMCPVSTFHHQTGHISFLYVPRFYISASNRAHLSSLCAPFLYFRIKPGTFVFFMCPVSIFHHQTGHISLLYVPRFYISSPNRIFGLRSYKGIKCNKQCFSAILQAYVDK